MALHGWSLQISAGGLCEWSPRVSVGGLCRSPWVSAGGLCGSPWVVVGKINQSKSVPMMSLNAVGNNNQSNSRCLHGSLWVSVGGLCRWSPWVFIGVCRGGTWRGLHILGLMPIMGSWYSQNIEGA